MAMSACYLVTVEQVDEDGKRVPNTQSGQYVVSDANVIANLARLDAVEADLALAFVNHWMRATTAARADLERLAAAARVAVDHWYGDYGTEDGTDMSGEMSDLADALAAHDARVNAAQSGRHE